MEGVIVAKIEPIGMERLEGTQTFENINRALMDEAISVVRYLIYADKAEDAMVEKFFKQTAENEMEHAKVMLKLLGALGEETDNLKKSFSIEAFVSKIDYPSIAEVAREEGFEDVATRFEGLTTIEARHRDGFKKLLDEIDVYTLKIKNKIKELKSEYREKVFYDLLNKGNIKIKNTFSFEPIIQASKLSSLRDKSLYEEEIDNLNSLENRLLTEIVSLDNIKWWHRNKDMKPGFCINAFINHYPDFIICTENENIIMVEVKGDDRTNDDSRIKLKLGSKWADKAGDKYFYFMVFENSKIEGSLLIDEFIDTIKEL